LPRLTLPLHTQPSLSLPALPILAAPRSANPSLACLSVPDRAIPSHAKPSRACYGLNNAKLGSYFGFFVAWHNLKQSKSTPCACFAIRATSTYPNLQAATTHKVQDIASFELIQVIPNT
jgi:hypothetical protein